MTDEKICEYFEDEEMQKILLEKMCCISDSVEKMMDEGKDKKHILLTIHETCHTTMDDLYLVAVLLWATNAIVNTVDEAKEILFLRERISSKEFTL